MKSLVSRVVNTAALLIVFGGLPDALSAQWPNYPTPGVPKGPDGKPDLTGPVPRTADGHPDLSGMWTIASRPRPAPCPISRSNCHAECTCLSRASARRDTNRPKD